MDEEQHNASAQPTALVGRTSLSDEELARLPVLKPGTQLEAGGVYVDLNGHEPVPFKALEGQVAGSGNVYVARRDVSHEMWNRIVEGQQPPDSSGSDERIDVPGESFGAYYERGEH
jgi:hypothetical protein